MEVDNDNPIEYKDHTKRFILRKSVRVAILILLYSALYVQAMITAIFNISNKSICEELRITQRTHEIFNFIFHSGEFIGFICFLVIMRRPDGYNTILFSVFVHALF